MLGLSVLKVTSMEQLDALLKSLCSKRLPKPWPQMASTGGSTKLRKRVLNMCLSLVAGGKEHRSEFLIDWLTAPDSRPVLAALRSHLCFEYEQDSKNIQHLWETEADNEQK